MLSLPGESMSDVTSLVTRGDTGRLRGGHRHHHELDHTQPPALHCWPQSTQLSLFYWQGRAGLGRANQKQPQRFRTPFLTGSTTYEFSFYFLNLFVSSEDDDICSLKHKYSIFIIHIQLHKFWRYHGIVDWLLGNINKIILWPKNWMNSVDYFR